jgi:hypothetical protein
VSLAVRVGYPLRLARARLAHRAGRMALVGLGVAAGACVLALVDAGSLVIRDRSLERAVAALPASQRVVQATWFGTLSTGSSAWTRLDAHVRPRLRTLNGGEPVAAMLYREASIHGNLVDLRAVDDVGRYVKLLSGRLPRRCVPTDCEVLRIAGAGPIPSTPQLRLIEVGRATLPAGVPFRDFLGRPPVDTSVLSRAIEYHTPPNPPLVLANGVRGLSQSGELATFFRSYAWFSPIRPGDVHPWSVDAFRARIDRVRSEIGAQSLDQTQFDLAAPVDELAAAAETGRASARRLLLLGGEAAALLLAFMMLAASSLRRDAEAARRRLEWFGARRWQLALYSLGETGLVAAAATIVGWAAGAGIGLLAASAAGAPAVGVVRHSAASPGGIAAAFALAAAAALLLFAALRAPAARLGGTSVSAVDMAALGALLAVAVGLARGDADAAALAGGSGTGAFLLLLPALVTFVAAVACVRVLVPLLRGLERVGRRGPLAVRLAALSLARRPGHAVVAVAFLVVSLGLALFAVVYRSTLAAGQRDQAAYAVPADFVLAEDLAQLVPVTHVRPPARGAFPVLRQAGDVSRLETSSGSDVLGIPAGRLEQVAGWRSDFAELSLAQLATAIRPTRPVSLQTVPLHGRTLALTVSARGYPVLLRATVRLANGDFASVRLGDTPFRGVRVLRARLPAGSRDLLGFSFGLLNGGRASSNAGTGLQPTANGTLELRGLRTDWSAWTGVGGVVADGPRLRYGLTTDVRSSFRLRQPTDGLPVPAIVSPALARAAGPDGRLPFEVVGERVVLEIAGVATHFPGTTQEDFVVADFGTLSTTLDADLAGLGTQNETWLNVPDGSEPALARRLAQPPYDLLAVQSRQQVEQELRGDPLARGALIVLAGTALVALGLALVGLVLGLVADVRDEGGELFDLESQGAAPSLLRRHLRLRTLAVAVVGAAGGIATGAVLSALVLSLVRVTANIAAPRPPLVLALDWRLVGLGAVAFLATAALAVTAGARLAFHARAAGRFREVA